MDQFERARIQAEKMEIKRNRYRTLSDESRAMRSGISEAMSAMTEMVKVKPPKTPVKRTNEIGITIYLNGEEIHMTARVNLNDVIASQRNRPAMVALFKEMLQSKFGRAEVT